MLDSVEAVIEAVGGPKAARALAGVGKTAISNWKARGKIASDKSDLFRDALAEKGLEASPSVFGFKLREEARA